MLLEIGMKIYCDEGRKRRTIDRVTAKRAYSKNNEYSETEFNRDIGDGKGSFTPRGSNTWSATHYFIETPELITKYNRFYQELTFRKIDPRSLSDAQLDRILIIAGGE